MSAIQKLKLVLVNMVDNTLLELVLVNMVDNST